MGSRSVDEGKGEESRGGCQTVRSDWLRLVLQMLLRVGLSSEFRNGEGMQG
jgi:hypothetical protein